MLQPSILKILHLLSRMLPFSLCWISSVHKHGSLAGLWWNNPAHPREESPSTFGDCRFQFQLCGNLRPIPVRHKSVDRIVKKKKKKNPQKRHGESPSQNVEGGGAEEERSHGSVEPDDRNFSSGPSRRYAVLSRLSLSPSGRQRHVSKVVIGDEDFVPPAGGITTRVFAVVFCPLGLCRADRRVQRDWLGGSTVGRWHRDVCGPALKSSPSRPPEPLPVILQSEDRTRKKRKNTECQREQSR